MLYDKILKGFLPINLPLLKFNAHLKSFIFLRSEWNSHEG